MQVGLQQLLKFKKGFHRSNLSELITQERSKIVIQDYYRDDYSNLNAWRVKFDIREKQSILRHHLRWRVVGAVGLQLTDRDFRFEVKKTIIVNECMSVYYWPLNQLIDRRINVCQSSLVLVSDVITLLLICAIYMLAIVFRCPSDLKSCLRLYNDRTFIQPSHAPSCSSWGYRPLSIRPLHHEKTSAPNTSPYNAMLWFSGFFLSSL